MQLKFFPNWTKLKLGATPLLYFKYWQNYTNTSASSRIHKKITKKEIKWKKQNTRNKMTEALEIQYVPWNDATHHSHMQQRERVHEIFPEAGTRCVL